MGLSLYKGSQILALILQAFSLAPGQVILALALLSLGQHLIKVFTFTTAGHGVLESLPYRGLQILTLILQLDSLAPVQVFIALALLSLGQQRAKGFMVSGRGGGGGGGGGSGGGGRTVWQFLSWEHLFKDELQYLIPVDTHFLFSQTLQGSSIVAGAANFLMSCLIWGLETTTVVVINVTTKKAREIKLKGSIKPR